MDKSTLPELLRPLMKAPTIKAEHCKVCGRFRPLEQHHIVRRGAGELFDEYGRKLKKPTITLCGFGNNLKDADGRPYCHGLAHHDMLHFRWIEGYRANRSQNAFHEPYIHYGQLEYLITKEPTKYQEALKMEGWRKVW